MYDPPFRSKTHAKDATAAYVVSVRKLKPSPRFEGSNTSEFSETYWPTAFERSSGVLSQESPSYAACRSWNLDQKNPQLVRVFFSFSRKEGKKGSLLFISLLRDASFDGLRDAF